MTENVKKLYDLLKSKEYRKWRKEGETPDLSSMDLTTATENVVEAIDKEEPVIFDGDNFGFNRCSDIKFSAGVGNLTPNYSPVITEGFDAMLDQIKENLKQPNLSRNQIDFGLCAISQLEAILRLCDRYKAAAPDGSKLKTALETIPRKGATTFYEACLFVKICIFSIRIGGGSHIGLGRFDQYMYPFYKKDIDNGATHDQLLEILEELFISINFDTDRYPGIQLGDNGQSMVLGGYDLDGNDMYNELSQLCMEASLELSLIDPKINLRVNKTTPIKRLEFATRLTKKGLGFPQYCNDDVVVPGLIALGYVPEDAANYTVAACWEYIPSGCGADFPNIETFDFPKVISDVIHTNLEDCQTMDELLECVKEAIHKECNILMAEPKERPWLFRPNIMVSLFVDGCIQSLTDFFHGGAKYMNFGCHGAGISTAADSLAAVKKTIFDDKSLTKAQLLDALNANFEGCENIRNLLLSCPKMGSNDDYVDSLATFLMDAFSGYLNGKPNDHGGTWRAGTGSAMEYIRKGEECPATADGRYQGTPYSSSFSPSPDANVDGLLSVIMSFTKFDMKKIINGGPLTIEIHDTVLRNEMGIQKTARLVSEFIKRGGHQLQLNSINRDVLLDAQKHPENYPNLIVRVWGWSGYFNELDVKYQSHIIKRAEFKI